MQHVAGAVAESAHSLGRQITSDLLERVVLEYNHVPIAAIVTPDESIYLSPKSVSTPHDLYEIGSLTKFFTAHLCLILEEQGIVDIDQPVGPVLRDIFPNMHSSLRKKTMYQLLTHTTGLKDPGNGRYYNQVNGNTVEVADYTLEDIDQFLATQSVPEQVAAPSYSNLGYALLGIILEKVTAQTYADLLNHYILHPLGMRETYVGMPDDRATQQYKIIGHSQGVQVPYWNVQHLPAFGSIVSSIYDLSIYFKHMVFSQGAQSPILRKLEATPLQIKGFSVESGVGWSRDTRYDGEMYVLTGRTLGFSSFVGWDTRHSRVVILLADSDTVGMMPYRWLNSRFPQDTLRKTIPISKGKFKDMAGKYEHPDSKDMTFSIVVSPSCITLASPREAPLILYQTDGGYFFSKQLSDRVDSLFFFEESGSDKAFYEEVEGDAGLVAKKVE